MTGKNLPREIRYAIDTVLRNRGYDDHAADAELYSEMLDEVTARVMDQVWQAD